MRRRRWLCARRTACCGRMGGALPCGWQRCSCYARLATGQRRRLWAARGAVRHTALCRAPGASRGPPGVSGPGPGGGMLHAARQAARQQREQQGQALTTRPPRKPFPGLLAAPCCAGAQLVQTDPWVRGARPPAAAACACRRHGQMATQAQSCIWDGGDGGRTAAPCTRSGPAAAACCPAGRVPRGPDGMG